MEIEKSISTQVQLAEATRMNRRHIFGLVLGIVAFRLGGGEPSSCPSGLGVGLIGEEGDQPLLAKKVEMIAFSNQSLQTATQESSMNSCRA